MKILILVALILQLVIVIKEADGYEFGDIVEFPKKCGPITVFKHYGIYVGPVNKSGDNDVGQGDNDIFHRTRKRGSNVLFCGFVKLEDMRAKSQDRVDNYLEEPGLLPPDVLQYVSTLTGRGNITKRINELKNEENCEKYDIINNNCEHLATYVRYGESVSFQKGTAAGPIERQLEKKQNTQALKRLEEKLEELRRSHETERQCAASHVASASSRSTITLSAYLALLSSFLI